MKIYLLMMLIGVIVSFSYFPHRRVKTAALPSPDSAPAKP
jgi:hypothetical protein